MTQDLTTRDIFQQLNTRLTRVEDDLRAEMNARFDQLQWRVVSLFVITWVTVIGSIWLKP